MSCKCEFCSEVGQTRMIVSVDQLKAENAKLKAEVERLSRNCTVTQLCHWSVDDDGIWTRSCDKGDWVCIEGSPKDNGMNYCPACGAILVEATND